jgi:general secretion pathway protein D
VLIRPMRSSIRMKHIQPQDHWYCRILFTTALELYVGSLSAGCGTFVSPDVKRGDQHLAAGNWEEASVAYRQALKDDPFESVTAKQVLGSPRACSCDA